jgi:DNA helicase-2/ATP-dependent DNA helicase PcrA
VSSARREGRRPIGGLDQAADAFRAYEQLKRRRGVIDFDDVLMLVLDDAKRDAEFAGALRWRFRHILVDEAQDLNPVQHRLIDVLRAGRDDLFLVGDPSQAIYGFNGADPRVLTEVETTFPGVEIVRLPVNHRCTPQVVEAGRHALSMAGVAPDVRARRHDGRVVTIHEADDDVAEAEFVAAQVSRGDPNLVHSGQIAVLARTNAQLHAFETAFDGVGVRVRRSRNAAGTPLAAALRRATDLTSPSALRAWAHDTLDDLDALNAAEARLAGLAVSGDRARASGRSRSVRPRRSGSAATSDAEEDVATIRAERQVAAALLDFLRDRPRSDGAEFRGWVAMTNPFDDATADGVDLLTFHGSKGREWHTVFVTGVESSLVPHKSATTAENKAEEARLLYVAMTRASDVLTLSAARRRGGYARKLSPFVADIDLTEPEALPPPYELIRKTRDASPIHVLRRWRADAARRANVLPPQLVSDSDLTAIAKRQPHTAEELADVTSMGLITARRLAPEILAALR